MNGSKVVGKGGMHGACHSPGAEQGAAGTSHTVAPPSAAGRPKAARRKSISGQYSFRVRGGEDEATLQLEATKSRPAAAPETRSGAHTPFLPRWHPPWLQLLLLSRSARVLGLRPR